RGEISGIDEATATKICEDLLSFANYGFPESHAWSFALIGYATAYLKAHYPTEFFFGLLNAQPMGFYPISTLVHDAKRHGVTVLAPCMVKGDWECTVCHPEGAERPKGSHAHAGAWDPFALRAQDDIALRLGWRFVRGVGDKTIDALRAAREERPFTSIA